MFNLGIFKVELANLSYLMPTPSNFPKSNVSSRNKNPYFTTKIALLGYFWARVLKAYHLKLTVLILSKCKLHAK